MNKIVRIGTISEGQSRASVYCRIKMSAKDNQVRLSITGVIGPLHNGNARGGAGQIEMKFQHRNPAHNDKRYHSPISAADICYAPGWDAEKWLDLLEVWHDWHLNDTRAGCDHQRKLGWTYEEHHDPKTFRGEECPCCGYSIGSKWLYEPLPAKVIAFLEALPGTDTEPAWC